MFAIVWRKIRERERQKEHLSLLGIHPRSGGDMLASRTKLSIGFNRARLPNDGINSIGSTLNTSSIDKSGRSRIFHAAGKTLGCAGTKTLRGT